MSYMLQNRKSLRICCVCTKDGRNFAMVDSVSVVVCQWLVVVMSFSITLKYFAYTYKRTSRLSWWVI